MKQQPAQPFQRQDMRKRVFDRFAFVVPALGASAVQLVNQLPYTYARVVACGFFLSLGAAVTNRQPSVAFSKLNVDTFYTAPFQLSALTLTGMRYSFAIGLGMNTALAANDNAIYTGPLPSDLLFDGDFTITFMPTTLTAGDQISQPWAEVERIPFT